MEAILMILAGGISFISGIFNGVMEVSMTSFRNSRISHWDPTFWELFGEGQAWKNIFVDRNPYSKVRVTWHFSILGRLFTVRKPIWVSTGYHFAKLCWNVFIALAVIPIAIVCHDVNGAIICSALLYFPQYLGFLLSKEYLIKKH